MTSPSITSINDEGCPLFSPKHKKIKYSDLYKTQPRAVRRESDLMKSQIKLSSNQTYHSVILEYLLKDKAMKKVVSAMDIITTLST